MGKASVNNCRGLTAEQLAAQMPRERLKQIPRERLSEEMVREIQEQQAIVDATMNEAAKAMIKVGTGNSALEKLAEVERLKQVKKAEKKAAKEQKKAAKEAEDAALVNATKKLSKKERKTMDW